MSKEKKIKRIGKTGLIIWVQEKVVISCSFLA
jgi:hypothetical protein